MSASDDLIHLLQKKRLPDGILKDHNRTIEMPVFIKYLETIFSQSLDEAIDNCDLTVEECYNLTDKLKDTSKKFDIKIIKHAMKKSEIFDDVLKSLSIGLHHRSPKLYADIVIEELASKNLPHDVWIRLLKRNDPWYLRISNQIEIIIITKSFETAPSPEVIAEINNDYSKRISSCFSVLITAISRTNLPVETWEKIKELSIRREVKKACDEKINQ
jgi:hypothetical protein